MDLLRHAVWELAGTDPGVCDSPFGPDRPDRGWIQALVPGTVAAALRDAGAGLPGAAEVDGTDWWLRTTVTGQGRHLLELDGIATVGDVWLAGRHVLRSTSMFRSHRIEVDLDGPTVLTVRCAAPLAGLGRRPRPRWKSTLVADQRWRWLRTTALGRIATWAGPVPPAGVWRPARLTPLDRPVLAARRLATRLEDGHGHLDVTLDLRGPASTVSVTVCGISTPLARDADGAWRGSVDTGRVAPWWPRGYGSPARHPVTLTVDGVAHDLGHVAFRTVTADTAGGAFGLRVNGVPVFARGAVWQPLDPVGFATDPHQVRAALSTLADGGHTLVRVPGTGVYETDDFYAACDELGLLVWQDCMLHTLDPPDTEEFTAELVAEVAELAGRLAGRGCVAVVCGGAETEQQPALLGLPATPLPALTSVLPQVLDEHLPGVPYVTSTPSGGALPVHTGTGVAQYFGVGAYQRPLADVRAAGVRFAGESLAFSIPPEPSVVLDHFGSPRVAGHDPRWKAAVPRDPAASWDFEDVRDHYVRELFGVDPAAERRADPARYLDLGRAAVCAAVVETLGWWRRPRSGCAGAVVLAARDLAAGAGWGLTDAAGHPKAPWFALRPVLAPTAVLVADDAGDGMSVTVVHDGPEPLHARLEIATFDPGGRRLDSATVPVEVAAHGAGEWSLDGVLGRFTDANHYYRFGPRSRDALHARLLDDAGEELARATVLIGHHLRPAAALTATVVGEDGGWTVRLRATTAVQWLAIDSPTHRPRDNWLHLAPGEDRVIVLDGPSTPPQLTVRALNVAERTVAAAPSGGTA